MNLVDVVVGYDVPLNRPLSWKLSDGARVHVVGANGVGKSTLLRTMAGRRPPLSGLIDIETDVRRVLVPDTPVFYDYLTPVEHLRLFSRLVDRKNVDMERLLARYNLGHVADVWGIRLSFGQSKRLSLMLADLMRPELLLLDEPLVGLDKRSSGCVDDLIENTVDRGGAVFVVSHIDIDGLDWLTVDMDSEGLKVP